METFEGRDVKIVNLTIHSRGNFKCLKLITSETSSKLLQFVWPFEKEVVNYTGVKN